MSLNHFFVIWAAVTAMSVPLFAQAGAASEIVPTTRQATTREKAIAERRELDRAAEASAEQRKRFQSLVGEYDRLYQRGLTDDANGLIPQIIASYAPSPFDFDDGSQWRGQSAHDQLSQFVDGLLRRNQKDPALAIVQACPWVSPAEVQTLFPNGRAPDAEHSRFIDILQKLADSNDYWIWVTMRYLQQTPHAGRFIKPIGAMVGELEQAVRKDPTNFKAARRYAVTVAAWAAHRPMGGPLRVEPPGKCDWMGDVCRPPNASDYLTLASIVLSTNSPEGAVHLLRAGMNAPITPADEQYCKKIRLLSSVTVSATNEQMIRTQMKSELTRCLKLAGHNDEAAELMKESRTTPRGWEAGQMDAGKANPLFEKAILDAQAIKGELPEYWMDRGDYYARRGDNGPAEEAYAQALKLAKPEGTPGVVTKSWVLARYIDFIARSKRDPKGGYEKLCAESNGFAPERTCRLVFDYRPAMEKEDFATGDDDRLWAVLDACPTWAIVQMRIVEKMIKFPGSSTQEKVIAKAADSAKGADPTRAAAVADALMMTANRAAWRKNAAEAERLYQHAASVLEEAIVRAKLGTRGADYLADPAWMKHTLLDAYRELKLWDKILRLYPEAESANANYPARELAIAAAMAGDKALALRHWQRSLTERPDKASVVAMAQAGCRDELIARAREMLKAIPANEGAKDVLTWLGADSDQQE